MIYYIIKPLELNLENYCGKPLAAVKSLLTSAFGAAGENIRLDLRSSFCEIACYVRHIPQCVMPQHIDMSVTTPIERWELRGDYMNFFLDDEFYRCISRKICNELPAPYILRDCGTELEYAIARLYMLTSTCTPSGDEITHEQSMRLAFFHAMELCSSIDSHSAARAAAVSRELLRMCDAQAYSRRAYLRTQAATISDAAMRLLYNAYTAINGGNI